MPSPVGHALAGAALALAAERSMRCDLRLRSLLIACVGLAVLPDVDLLYQPIHRAFTHSVGSAILVLILATAVTGKVTRRWALTIGLVCTAAWSSHILLDWLGADPSPPSGIKALWPFSDRWFISDWSVFLGTERRHPFTPDSIRQNLRTVAREVLLLAPIVVLLFLVRRGGKGREGGEGSEESDSKVATQA